MSLRALKHPELDLEPDQFLPWSNEVVCIKCTHCFVISEQVQKDDGVLVVQHEHDDELTIQCPVCAYGFGMRPADYKS